MPLYKQSNLSIEGQHSSTANYPTEFIEYLMNNLRHSELRSCNEEVQDKKKNCHADVLLTRKSQPFIQYNE